MVSRLARYPLSEGGDLLIEIDGSEGSDQPLTAKDALQVRMPLDSIVARVKPGLAALVKQLRDQVSPPEQITVQFGIRLTGGFDAVVTKSAEEGNFKITLTWAGKTCDKPTAS